MKELLFEKLEKSYGDMVEIRRYLHMNPEVSFKEEKTAAYLADFYNKLGIEVRTGVGGNGLIAKVKGGKPGKTVALRADFDALPIQDQKETSYASQVPGVMHACGHDGHTAALLQLAKAMHEMREDLSGEYVFIHQHAEELAPGGAVSMIEDGCLDGVDVIFGTHLWSLYESGVIYYASGPVMAAPDKFHITIQGAGGHGAAPHQTKDAIVIGAQLIMNLQQIVSRRVDPIESAVLSVGSFISDNAFNVIADQAVMTGTVRTFTPELRDLMEEEIHRVVQGTAVLNNCEITVDYSRGYPAVVNHEKETEFLKSVAETIPGLRGVEEMKPQMGGEDFSYYLEKVPGTFFFTGAKPENAYPHHHPRFDFDETAMLAAAKTLGAAAIEFQS
ncbi:MULTISPECIES: M20 family metallopeptidase [unclassified Sporosarcina]|uniref:M20 family metallopeptidase n=1 Tax=unclassified Sporosarcina TaxID=2647733 RepID=UPI00203FBEF8|nr:MULTISPECIES: M20 family metallopeptidase [unclassified Sporosarcina]GKV64894.1 putative amidohydrolase YhaA [Sporosarcina sp. NCCP-2331]GLB55004.1 putative amidohydrolase YhaA [Sporosarcina sp. NCCP-2378]